MDIRKDEIVRSGLSRKVSTITRSEVRKLSLLQPEQLLASRA